MATHAVYRASSLMERVEAFIQEHAKSFNLNFKIENLDRFAKKRRLTEDQVIFIRKIHQILEDIIPGQYDIQFDFSPVYKIFTNEYGPASERYQLYLDFIAVTFVYVVIHYPVIKITNEPGEEHIIHDLFLRLPIRIGKIEGDSSSYPTQSKDIAYYCSIYSPYTEYEFHRPQGTRTTVTKSEYNNNYLHSHLRTTPVEEYRLQCKYSDFCTGESEINMVTSILSGCDGESFDEEQFKLLILQCQMFVSWESLEGGPYIKIADVKDKNYNIPNPGSNTNNHIWDNFLRNVGTRPINLDWTHERGNLVILNNDKIDSLFREVLDDSFFMCRDVRGRYYIKREPEHHNPPVGVTNWLPFRGERWYFTVIDSPPEREDNETQKYLNPKTKTYVKSKLEHLLKSYLVREAGINRVNTSHY